MSEPHWVSTQLGRPALVCDELESHVEPDAETVEEIFPVRPADHERDGLLAGKLSERPFPAAPERPEMHVLDPAHVEALVDEQAPIQRLGVKPADQVPAAGMGAEVHRLVRIHQQHVHQRTVVADAAHGPGVGHGGIGLFLFRVKHGQAVQGGILMQREERLALGLARAGHGQQRAAAVLRAGGGRAEHAFQHHILRHVQRRFDQVVARWNEDGVPAGGGGGFHGGHEGAAVIGLAVTHGPEVADIEMARRQAFRGGGFLRAGHRGGQRASEGGQ